VSISVLIMTLNEEMNLEACLAAVSWSDDIVVLDSFSTDRTLEIARNAGARIVKRAYDNERNQRMFGFREIAFKHPWVYIPDADEITPPELRDEMLAIAADPTRQEVAFRCRFKTLFMGQWIRHSSLYPTWVVRLVRPDRIEFHRDIHMLNLHCDLDGPEGVLKNHFLHYSFNKGLTAWFDKHNRYATVEAVEALKSLSGRAIGWPDLFSLDSVRRRRAMKELAFRLPYCCRPVLRFLYMYVIRRGFLDGWAGYLYCGLIATYDYMIVSKMAEIRRREQGLPV
jgi:glycosyltransferase involved in cell wall biosynthesis